jgi:lysophospholipase L1-like esterase
MFAGSEVSVLTRIVVGLLVISVLSVFAAATIRASWIKRKIATLSSPPQTLFASANASLAGKGQLRRIVLIGDSKISRWPSSANLGEFEVINRGIGGETAAQLAERFGSDAIALNPDIVFIESGLNDLVAATFLEEADARAVTNRTATILERLADQGTRSGAMVLLATIIPPGRPEILRLPVWKESLREAVAIVNGDLRRAAFPQGVTLVDVSAALADGQDRLLPVELQSDALHLNQAGYERLTQVLASALQRLQLRAR